MNSHFRGHRQSTAGGRFAPRRGRSPHMQHPRGGGRGGKKNQGQYIDPSRFINKSVVIEEVVPYVPTHHFKDFAIDERIKHNIMAKGYDTPTPIQDQSVPHVLQGRDIVGIADTGSGKTAAFLIPLLHRVVKDRNMRVLIMVPTRELAQQIEEEFKGFARGSGFLSACIVGGANINPQLRALRQNPLFVIGTPGRIKDVMSQGALDLSKFNTVVLDEADRMLDMGFVRDMRFILSFLPKDRHTLFFSATLSKDIEALIGDFLIDPVRVSVKTRDTASSVEQDIVRIPHGAVKFDVLKDLLSKPEFKKVIVFGRTKHGTEKLSKLLERSGFASESIHGNKNQNKRQRALDAFKQNKIQVLCATDVAARGIDVSDVTHVINYDIPTTYEDYVHRIGRTGRAGKRGVALTFVEQQ